jgi:hypothetical protein
MSGVKKAVKGVVKAVKGVVKGVTKFVKKYWKQIVIAAAIVFTAGIATVGIAGFSSAMAAAGGGFTGFMSAAGSTMVAGVASIGGSLGIGSGVTASTAGGAFAAAPVMSGVAAGSGLTLGTGAAAQSLGLAASTYGAGAGAAGAAGGAAGGAGSFNALTGAGTYTGAGSTAANASYLAHAAETGSLAGVPAGSAAAGAAGAAGSSGALGAAAAGAGKQGLLSTVMNSRLAGPLLSAGIQGISGYMQGKQQQELAEEQWDREKPLSYWGVGARGESNGGGAVSSPFQPGSTLTTTPNQASNATPGAPNVPGSFQVPNAPNGSRGLMASAWDINQGMPVDADGNPIYNWN